ncbi:MarR family winged helix-turn-helix transcriptional regulator [Oceanobacillus sp. Castelsardo]|uniref:MarR family winged helix-turn-helix transcriptional regulator n=1 Tax=Oceanobacillus sp. Castelsardo TaxID=1851204 RepID=UPI000838D2C0|nr:MarR family transcriptional regulator [Oceanobacillus sp. Castelsardo]
MDSFFHHQLQFTRAFTKKINEQLAKVGLYHSQWSIVFYLKHFNSATLVEISNYYDVEKPTITRTVNRLEEMGLIEKIPSTDKREKKIHLTEKGMQVYDDAKRIVDTFEQNLISEISDEDLMVTLHTIQKLKEDVQKVR